MKLKLLQLYLREMLRKYFSKKTGSFLRTLPLNLNVDKLIQILSSAQTSLNILRGTNKYQIDI